MRNLESLDLWKLSQQLACAAYTLSSEPQLARHFALIDQIRRAALSVPANITEGYALGSTSQFTRCLRISLGSAAELLSHLTVVRSQDLVDVERIQTCMDLCDRVIAMTIALIRNLMRKNS